MKDIVTISRRAPPFAWRCVTKAINAKSYALLRDYQLVFQARGIEFIIWRTSKSVYFFVPALSENIALAELRAYRAENKRLYAPKLKWPVHKRALRVCFFLLPLLLFYPLQHGTRYFSWLPPPEELLKLGALNYNECIFHGQWHRLVTALTLHIDIAHLTGNLFFGAIFLYLLARLIGYGRALFLCVCSAILANFFAVIFREPGYVSVGFSTAVFASLGLIVGVWIRRFSDPRKMFISLAASFAILSLLGTEGAATDYASHIAGLVCGIFLGLICAGRGKLIPQLAYGIGAWVILALGWLFALY